MENADVDFPSEGGSQQPLKGKLKEIVLYFLSMEAVYISAYFLFLCKVF